MMGRPTLDAGEKKSLTVTVGKFRDDKTDLVGNDNSHDRNGRLACHHDQQYTAKRFTGQPSALLPEINNPADTLS